MGKDFMRVIQSGEIQRQHEVEIQFQNTSTIDQKVERHLGKIRGVVLTAYAIGSQRRFFARLPDGYHPPELVDEIRESEIRENNERIRRNNLTPAQRDQEQSEILRQLGASPGFVHMRIPIRQQNPAATPKKAPEETDRFSDIDYTD